MKSTLIIVLLLCSGISVRGKSKYPDTVLQYELSKVKPEYHWVIYKDPDGYIDGKLKLILSGVSEEEAINCLFQRAAKKLKEQEEKKKRAKIMADIEYLPPMQKRMALQDVDMYIARRKRFEYMGTSAPERELWLLGLKRTKDWRIEIPHGAPPSFMEEELRNARNREELKREIPRIEYLRKWLSHYAPPSSIPVSTQRYNDTALPLAERLASAKAERQELQRYARYYAEQLRQQENQQQKYQELIERIDNLENQIRNQNMF